MGQNQRSLHSLIVLLFYTATTRSFNIGLKFLPLHASRIQLRECARLFSLLSSSHYCSDHGFTYIYLIFPKKPASKQFKALIYCPTAINCYSVYAQSTNITYCKYIFYLYSTSFPLATQRYSRPNWDSVGSLFVRPSDAQHLHHLRPAGLPDSMPHSNK